MVFASPTTLRRRMIVTMGLMVLGTIAVSVGAMIAVNGLHQDLSVAVQGYGELRQLYDVGFLASKAREATSANPPQPQRANEALRAALAALNDSADSSPLRWTDESAKVDCRRLLSQAIDQLNAGVGAQVPAMNVLFSRMSRIADDVRTTIASVQTAADRKRRNALAAIVGLCSAVVLVAAIVGIYQYRRVTQPLRRISAGVRGFAKGQFDQRIQGNGDREFIALAADFNHMADELQTLYRDLEQKVHAKSKELVRAERLASVGYLAAGVAHEINNPLGIIAGYGERAIQQLSVGVNETTLPRTQKALAIICEEVFRCKQITDRLLSLARQGPDERQVFSIANLAETVIATLSGLGTVGNRKLTLTSRDNTDTSVLANEGELKQVLLNLIINGLEAVSEVNGVVNVRINRTNDVVALSVIDNGNGMAPDTLDRIFQPFYTEKRGQRHGTGLGLSIAQAIITDHGGRIVAHSDGLNQGSIFTLHLPAAGKDVAVVAEQP